MADQCTCGHGDDGSEHVHCEACDGPRPDPCPSCGSPHCEGPSDEVDDSGLPAGLCWRARRGLRRTEEDEHAEAERERASEVLGWIGEGP